MTTRKSTWKRSKLASTATLAALTGTLLVAAVPGAQAEEVSPEAATTSETTESLATDTTESANQTQGLLPKDSGIILPTKNGTEVAVDVLGRGYEQRITIERMSGATPLFAIKIYDHPVFGGGLLGTIENPIFTAGWPNSGDYFGIDNITTAKMPGNRVTATPDGYVYVTRTYKTDFQNDPVPDSAILKIKVNKEAISASHIESFYSPRENQEFHEDKVPLISALDSFTYKNPSTNQEESYLALGLTRGGVKIIKTADMGASFRTGLYPGWLSPGILYQGDTVSAVKFGTDAQGKLVLGIVKFTFNDSALYLVEPLTGAERWRDERRGNLSPWWWANSLSFGPAPTSAHSKELTLSVGWDGDKSNNEQRWYKVHPSTGENAYLMNYRPPTGWGAATTSRSFVNASGKNVTAVTRGAAGIGQILGENTVGALESLVDAPTDALAARYVPGYKSMSFDITNATSDALQVQAFSGESSAKGCWLNTGLRGARPAPTRAFTVARGETTETYGNAQTMMGADDGCNADSSGAFFVEVTSPDGRTKQQAKIQVDNNTNGANNVPRIAEQRGDEYYKFEIVKKPWAVGTGLLGQYNLSITQQGAPTAVSAPTIFSGKRLTPEAKEGHVDTGFTDDPTRPVYRFTVSDAKWKVPGADTGLGLTTLPAMMAQGSKDGVTWNNLGTITPKTQPVVEGDHVTLKEASFDWQTASTTAPDYQYFRVLNGELPSETIDSHTLPAPAPFSELGYISHGLTKPSFAPAPQIHANGLDQAAGWLKLLNKEKDPKPYDPENEQYKELYNRVYFRKASGKALITGLGDPANPNNSISVSTVAGAYANNQATPEPNSRNMYISSTAAGGNAIDAVFKPTGEDHYTLISQVSIAFQAVTSQMNALPGAKGGAFQVGPCVTGACTIANTSKGAALFAVNENSFGLQFRSRAFAGNNMLPVGHDTKKATARSLPYTDIAVDEAGTTAKMLDTTTFYAVPTFSTTVVANGTRVGLELPVG